MTRNAIKYGAGQPVQVVVHRGENLARISVQDAGIGIERRKQEIIFGRFERAVAHRHISGLGLGLYIARRIVQAHQGSLSVRSEVGKGSLFVLELPVEPEVTDRPHDGLPSRSPMPPSAGEAISQLNI